MAIPFVLPNEEDPETTLEVLFQELSDILTRIQILRRSTSSESNNNQPSRLPRVVTNTGPNRRNRRVSRGVPNPEGGPPFTIPPLFNPASDLALVDLHNLNIPNTFGRKHFLRRLQYPLSTTYWNDNGALVQARSLSLVTSTELTNGRWAADAFTFSNTVDNNKVYETTEYEEYYSNGENGFFSKLIPSALSHSIWTAVICVVGWHLLRSR